VVAVNYSIAANYDVMSIFDVIRNKKSELMLTITRESL